MNRPRRSTFNCKLMWIRGNNWILVWGGKVQGKWWVFCLDYFFFVCVREWEFNCNQRFFRFRLSDCSSVVSFNCFFFMVASLVGFLLWNILKTSCAIKKIVIAKMLLTKFAIKKFVFEICINFDRHLKTKSIYNVDITFLTNFYKTVDLITKLYLNKMLVIKFAIKRSLLIIHIKPIVLLKNLKIQVFFVLRTSIYRFWRISQKWLMWQQSGI